MATSDLTYLSELCDLLRAKGVAHFESGELKILFAPEEETEEEVGDEPEKATTEVRSKLTGLTPTQESELFYSSE